MIVKKFTILTTLAASFWMPNAVAQNTPKVAAIVITDCYHPYQDPGDNLDLIQGYALPDVDLRGIILDITDAFRKDTADHPTLWKDPGGPREAGIVPVEQLNYIFNRNVPFAVGPMSQMNSETDAMKAIPAFQQEGVNLFLKLLKSSTEPVEVLSFGSARVLAVAFNREPELLRMKIKRIHLCAGTATRNGGTGSDQGVDAIPGGEWNVALDVFAFTRILKSGLPVALYPCAGENGVFATDVNSSYWKLKDMSFLREMHPKLQCYLDYAFSKKLQYDFLRAMDQDGPYRMGRKIQFDQFHVWETAVWLKATGRELIKDSRGKYAIVKHDQVKDSDTLLPNDLRPCKLTEIRNDGHFCFEYTKKQSNITIYYRPNPQQNEKALNMAVPELYKTFNPSNIKSN
ncbi:MAG: hypothetical protein RBS73_13765 [Prolixibacteraceae bacterium]|jgi:hypothetical protein|nr:hypothetical protein [Prolixibacteraceae bacterium]